MDTLRLKPLRVTSPAGQQRGTYRLQLPYRYGVPLLVGSGILHWLVSQSIFLARVSDTTKFGGDAINADDPGSTSSNNNNISTCGYSPIAIIFVIVFGSVTMLFSIACGLRRSTVGMPIAGSCSAAISAACHPPPEDLNVSSKPVMWGVVAKENIEASATNIEHCSFTSFEVEGPERGNWYSGHCSDQRLRKPSI